MLVKLLFLCGMIQNFNKEIEIGKCDFQIQVKQFGGTFFGSKRLEVFKKIARTI